jgi:hypothetical protein
MSHLAASDLHRASCACGQVQLHAEGKPYRVGLCHCFDCRKAHGAPFAAFVIFPADKVRVTGADGSLAEGALRSFARTHAYRRFFCAACGSHVFGRSDGSDEIELHLGSFDEANVDSDLRGLGETTRGLAGRPPDPQAPLSRKPQGRRTRRVTRDRDPRRRLCASAQG